VPQQARSQVRFDAILDMAGNLFEEKGFEATSTNEIAQRAGISIGSLYQYFDNKEAIVEALTERYVEALRGITDHVMAADVQSLPASDAVDRLLDPILQFHAAHPAFRALWLATDVSADLRAAMKGMDVEVLGRIEKLLKWRVPNIEPDRARMVVNVMGTAVKALLGLLGRSNNRRFKAQAAAEMKRMITAYIEDVMDDIGVKTGD
jgi:AcrR family transcriptional regulator